MTDALQGRRTRISEDRYFWTPAWQECVCGAADADYNDSFTRRYYSCCQLTYLGDRIVAVGRVWLNTPMRPKRKPSAAEIRAVMADCAPPPAGMTTALYRRYDRGGVLLYAGISDDLTARSRWHERHSPWAQFVHRRTTEWFASRIEAEVAEVTVIKVELPLFNKQHAAAGQAEEAARYLRADKRVRQVAPNDFQK